MQKITPTLWFEQNIEEAVNFYVGVFNNSRIIRTTLYGDEGFEIHHMPKGEILTMEFEIEGTRFLALNGGPAFKFNEAVSFIVYCYDQLELDYYWDKLSEGGDPKARQCGWLKDKFGLSWQVTPAIVPDMLADEDHAKSERVMRAMMQMKKLDFRLLQEAYRGEATAPLPQ